MAKGKKPSNSNDFTETKQFSSAQEIEFAIQRLRRRVEEVRSLQRDQIAYDDQRVKNAEQNIRNSVLEIFGPNSPEYGHIHQSWWEIFVPSMHLVRDEYQKQRIKAASQQEFNQSAVPQTITMLEGLIQRLEEKRCEAAGDPTARTKTAFEEMELHPRIAAVCADLYRDGHFRQALLDSSIALVNFVKEKSRRHDLDGVPLMSTVFSPNSPILAFNSLADQTDKDEQQGMMHLFMGAVLALRNPRAHSVLDDSPELALDAIAFLSMLAKRLDGATRC